MDENIYTFFNFQTTEKNVEDAVAYGDEELDKEGDQEDTGSKGIKEKNDRAM